MISCVPSTSNQEYRAHRQIKNTVHPSLVPTRVVLYETRSQSYEKKKGRGEGGGGGGGGGGLRGERGRGANSLGGAGKSGGMNSGLSIERAARVDASLAATV
jgi:hypothetical protein